MVASPRRFHLAVLFTVCLLIGPFLIPGFPAPSVALIAGIFLGVPISILLYRDHVRAEHQVAKSVYPGVAPSPRATVLFRLLGATSITIGASIILWVAYNEWIEQLPHYRPVPWVGPFGIGPLLCIAGWHWLRRPTDVQR